MSDARLEELKSDVEELKSLLAQAKRKRVQDLLSVEVRKLETEVIHIQEALRKVSVAADTGAGAGAGTAGTSSTDRHYEIKLNGYGWDQSDKYIKIFVTLKDVQKLPKEQVYCTLTERSMELHVKNLENKDYVLVINKLLEPINVDLSHWKQKTDMVVVFLSKSRTGSKWSHVTELEKRFEDNKSNKFKTDGLNHEDPQDSIMGLMKNMYESGDDEMKRMIAKAWTEGQEKKKPSSIDL